MANGVRTSSPGVDLIESILQGPSDIARKFFGPGGFEPTGREGGETALQAFSRLFEMPTAPATGGADIDRLMAAISGAGAAGRTTQGMLPRGTLQQAGPITFETGEGGRQIVRSVTGGFAPGSLGAQIQAMLPQILASLTGAAGGPTRESLLEPRLADIDAATQAATNALLNRFASLGRSAVGSTTQEALGDISGRSILERQRAMGDVDTLLANIATARQGNLMQLLSFLVRAGMA